MIVHEPAGIEQLAVYVGAVENPVALSGNVNEPPAAPVCDGVGVVTAGGLENVAVTDVFAEMLNAHIVLVPPLHAPPDQLVNVSPLFGTAVNVIIVPDANEVPVGDCVIVPGPLTFVVSVYCGAVNVADTAVFAVAITMHAIEPVFVHAPPQLENVAPVFGTAVKFTVVLFAKDVPVGDCVIVPGPVTLVEKVNFVTVVTPVPVSCAPTSAPLGPLMLSVAARPPKACGVKITVTEHDDPAGAGDVQVFICEKSPGFEPPSVIEDTVMGPVALAPFSSVKVNGDEDPVAVSGNKIGEGATKIGSGIGGGGVIDVAEI